MQDSNQEQPTAPTEAKPKKSGFVIALVFALFIAAGIVTYELGFSEPSAEAAKIEQAHNDSIVSAAKSDSIAKEEAKAKAKAKADSAKTDSVKVK